jgi:hypothetical protein
MRKPVKTIDCKIEGSKSVFIARRALTIAPGVNPVPLLVPLMALMSNVAAFTLRAMLPPSPNR